MSNSRIKVQIIPSRSGKTWSVWVNGWPIIRQTYQPLTEIARRMIAAGHKPHRAIVMTRTPAGPCRGASTLGAAAMADATQHPFRAPAWTSIDPPTGSHMQ